MSRIEEIKKQMQELQKELEFERQNSNEFEYPFESDEGYLYLDNDGSIAGNWWNNHYMDKQCYRQGNVFKTKEEAEKERDRRELEINAIEVGSLFGQLQKRTSILFPLFIMIIMM